jgi:hypothetical protein
MTRPHSWNIDITNLPQLPEIKIGRGYDLLREFEKLNQLRSTGLADAIAFYSARIIEVTVADLALRLGLLQKDRTDDLFNLLWAISESGSVQEGYLACANTLRRIGNSARHMNRSIYPEEISTIIALLQVWITGWTKLASDGSIDLSQQPQWSSLTSDIISLTDNDAEKLTALLSKNDTLDSPYYTEPTLAAFVVERLVDNNEQAASAFSESLLARFPDDARSRQVRALYLSRNGRFAESIALLQELKHKDTETLGILGGAHKNIWLQTNNLEELKKAYSLYMEKPIIGARNYYLTLNSAATALWLKMFKESWLLAQKTINIMSRFNVNENSLLRSKTAYWLTASYAEASFLLGRHKTALCLYQHAKEMDNTGGRWQRSATQLTVHMRYFKENRGYNKKYEKLIEK